MKFFNKKPSKIDTHKEAEQRALAELKAVQKANETRKRKEFIPREPWATMQELLFNQDRLLNAKGKTIQLYKDMMLDSTIKSAIQIRKDLVLASGYSIEPEEDTAEGRKQADFVNYVFNNLETIPFEDFLDNVLDWEWLGYVVGERKWAAVDGQWIYTDLKLKDPLNFYFKIDMYGNLEKVTLQYKTDGYEPKDVILGTYPYVVNGNYYGTSCLQSIYREYWSKKNIVQFRNKYLQGRGCAPLVAVYPEGDTTSASTASAILESLQDDFYTTLPGYMNEAGELVPAIDIKLLETATGKGTDEFESAISQLDKAMTRGLLMPDNLGFTDTSAGSYAQTKVQYKTVIYGNKKRIRSLTNFIISQLINPLLKANYENPEKIIIKFENIEDELTESRATILKTLIEGGIIEPKEDWIRKYLSLPDGEVVEEEPSETVDKKANEVRKEEEESDMLKAYHFKENLKSRNYQKSIDFKQIGKNMMSIEEEMLKDLGPIFDSMSIQISNQVQKKIFNEGNLSKLQTLRFRGIGEIRDVFLTGTFLSYIQGKLDVSEEINGYSTSNVDEFKQAELETIMLQEASISGLYNDLLGQKLTIKNINAFLAKYGTKLSKADIQKLNDLKNKSFSIAGDDINEQLLVDIKKIIRTGFGVKPESQIVKEINQSINKFVELAVVDPNVAGSSIEKAMEIGKIGRLRTIVRNATSTEYNQGRVNQALDPALRGFVEAAQYSAILDSNTTAFCEAHDGEVVDVGNSDFITLTPQNHHLCRSIWVFFFRGEDYKKNWMTKTDTKLKKIYKTDNLESIKLNYNQGYPGFGKA